MMILKNYFLNSSIHGLHFIVDRRFHLVERIFWTISVIISWFLSVWTILQAMNKYKTASVAFNVDTSYLNFKSDFPSIVFCQQYASDSTIAASWTLRDKHLIKIVKNILYYKIGKSMMENCMNPDFNLKEKENCLKLGNFSEYMKNDTMDCTELFSYCAYRGKTMSCCDNFLKIDGFFGPCYSFNSIAHSKYKEKLKRRFVIRRLYGNLSIEVKKNNLFISAMSPSGVPSKKNMNLQILDTDTQWVKVNSTYNIFLSTTVIHGGSELRVVNPIKRKCNFPNENDLKSSTIYSLPACQNECSLNKQLLYCNCVLHNYPKFRTANDESIQECNITGMNCISQNSNKINSDEGCICPVACHDLEVKTIGSTEIKNARMKNQESVAKFNFIVHPPTVTFIRTLVRTPLDMIVSIGGVLGLFIGASILTIVEIVFYFIVRPLGNKYLKAEAERAKNRFREGKKSPTVSTLPYVN